LRTPNTLLVLPGPEKRTQKNEAVEQHSSRLV